MLSKQKIPVYGLNLLNKYLRSNATSCINNTL